jgi:hypothetical protein
MLNEKDDSSAEVNKDGKSDNSSLSQKDLEVIILISIIFYKLYSINVKI